MSGEIPLLSPVRRRWLAQPRRVWALIAAFSVGLLGFGLYLQHIIGLEPCPMCIMQRYLWLLVGLVAALGALTAPRVQGWLINGGLLVLSVGGAYVAARQSWLQWHPPSFASCGRDFYGIVETFPLHQALPMIFRGSGDCSAIDWTFLGGTIANWSFVCFVTVAGVALALLVTARRR